MEDITKKTIGTRINCALANADKLQKDLAKELNVTDNTVSYFCNGKRTPNVEQLITISKFLDVSTDYLLGLSDVPTTDTEVQAICEYTGLNEEAVTTLHNNTTLNEKSIKDESLKPLKYKRVEDNKRRINDLINSNFFLDILSYCDDIEAINCDIHLMLCVFNNDFDSIKSSNYYYNNLTDTISSFVINHRDDNINNFLKDKYDLSLFKAQKSCNKYISEKCKIDEFDGDLLDLLSYYYILDFDDLMISDEELGIDELNQRIDELRAMCDKEQTDYMEKKYREYKNTVPKRADYNGND